MIFAPIDIGGRGEQRGKPKAIANALELCTFSNSIKHTDPYRLGLINDSDESSLHNTGITEMN